MVVAAIRSKVNGSYQNENQSVVLSPDPTVSRVLLLVRVQMCFQGGNSFLLLSPTSPYSHRVRLCHGTFKTESLGFYYNVPHQIPQPYSQSRPLAPCGDFTVLLVLRPGLSMPTGSTLTCAKGPLCLADPPSS